MQFEFQFSATSFYQQNQESIKIEINGVYKSNNDTSSFVFNFNYIQESKPQAFLQQEDEESQASQESAMSEKKSSSKRKLTESTIEDSVFYSEEESQMEIDTFVYENDIRMESVSED